MRVFAVILASGFLLNAGPAMAGEHVPKNIRVCVQFIEMPHTALTELMSGKAQPGHVLHEKAMAMTKQGKAKVVESAVLIGREGLRSTSDSVREIIYFCEYEPSMSPPNIPQVTDLPIMIRPAISNPICFESRKVGVLLELDADSVSNPNIGDMTLIAEITKFIEFRTHTEYRDSWGDSSIRMPTFESWRLRYRLGASLGKFDLATTITPKPTEPVPATLRKILVFVRCDVIAVGKP